MNLVSVLIAPAIVKMSIGDSANLGVRVVIGVVAVAIIAGAVLVSKRRAVALDAGAPQAQVTR